MFGEPGQLLGLEVVGVVDDDESAFGQFPAAGSEVVAGLGGSGGGVWLCQLELAPAGRFEVAPPGEGWSCRAY
ncbi:hypothetical protein [Mycolicibacterium mageritense]|uniref:hypothetical protein n=1 Tax=Mycolicibacterium mageritense TaxID=53462 RepID=UPI001E5BC2F2|nr:hypothetical protein [Mycolicibacterium mageritense]